MPSPSSVLKLQEVCSGDAIWTTKLKRSDSLLEVSVVWSRKRDNDVNNYHWMHIVHLSGRGSIARTPINPEDLRDGCSIQCDCVASEVTHGDAYVFDVVFTQVKEIKTPTLHPFKNHDLFPLLLRDISSVDVCFAFAMDDGRTPPVRLWAHRVVLSRHKVFDKLIADEEARLYLMHNASLHTKESDVKYDSALDNILDDDGLFNDTIAASNPSSPARTLVEPLVIKIEDFSFATMSALLYYIYTDKIDLSIDPTRFAISTAKEDSSIGRHPADKHHHAIVWHPLADHSPWRLKDVTWDNLMEATDYYGISDLHSICRTKVVERINESSVFRTLFRNSAGDPTVKKAAMEFINNNLDSMFGNGQDPFALYRDDPVCHDVLIELTRLRLKTA
ncbi:hypothetical protein BGX29_000385 [Mortierella sp. GBA35]|nr:hypothetical protein BGX29_000385 [Mortierella sp. GBA35]